MKITKRGVSLSALSIMAGAAIAATNGPAEAVAPTTNMEVKATVASFMAMQLEWGGDDVYTSNGIEVLSRDTDADTLSGSTMNRGIGTLDFGTINALGLWTNIGQSGSMNYKLYAAAGVAVTNDLGLSSTLGGMSGTGSDTSGTDVIAKSFVIDNDDKLQVVGNSNPSSDATAGGLYVIGANAGLGAVRHHMYISGGPQANASISLYNSSAGTGNPWSDPSDASLPVYVTNYNYDWTGSANGSAMPTSTTDDGDAGGTTDGVQLVGYTSTKATDLGVFTGQLASEAISTTTNFMNDEYGVLDYAVRVAPDESTGNKFSVMIYSATAAPGSIQMEISFG